MPDRLTDDENSLFLPKNWSRPRVGSLPIEEIIVAGPCVDLGLANLTFETSRMRACVLLFCRGVIDPAIGAGEMLARPYAASHHANMRLRRPGSSRYPQPQTAHYLRQGAAAV